MCTSNVVSYCMPCMFLKDKGKCFALGNQPACCIKAQTLLDIDSMFILATLYATVRPALTGSVQAFTVPF